MLDHAARVEVREMAAAVQAMGDEAYREAIGMCVYAAAYVAVDVSGRWPSSADVREIARVVAEGETKYRLDSGEVRDYLGRAALGFDELDQALGGIEAAAAVPVLITASLLLRFCPGGQEWFTYLDEIWNAYLAAENLAERALPAVHIRLRRAQALAIRDDS